MNKEKLQQHLGRIEKETARLEGERRMLVHLAKEEGIIDQNGKVINNGS